MTQQKQSSSFQKLFNELERLVEKFERGEIDLDQGLESFEHGLKLAEILKKKLKDAENKIVEIKKKFEDHGEE